MNELENYKQFTEDLNTGKRLLLDYKNNKIECSVYGAKKFKYFFYNKKYLYYII